MPSCLRLLEQLMRLAASRTFCTAGKSKPIRTPMMAITTSNSINVKPGRRRRKAIEDMGPPCEKEKNDCASNQVGLRRRRQCEVFFVADPTENAQSMDSTFTFLGSK